MNNKHFFKDLGWRLGYPFVLLHLAVKFAFAKSKLKKYLKRPEDFLDDEKYETIFKLTKPICYILRIKTVDLFKDKKISKKPQLIISNHRSIVDALILFRFLYGTIGPKFVFVAKKELEEHKYGKILKLIDTIFIDRDNLRDVVNIINKEKEIISKQHKSIIIFPEGTRNTSNELIEFKSATFEVAFKTMCVIQPIVLYNTENFLENKKNKTNDGDIYMEILKNIQPNNYVSIDRKILSKNIQRSMQVQLDNLIKAVDDLDKINKNINQTKRNDDDIEQKDDNNDDENNQTVLVKDEEIIEEEIIDEVSVDDQKHSTTELKQIDAICEIEKENLEFEQENQDDKNN